MDHGAGCCSGMSHGATAKADDKAAHACCADMKMDHTAAKADGASAGCCANMNHGTAAKADDKAAGGCCASMKADGAAADPHAGHTADVK